MSTTFEYETDTRQQEAVREFVYASNAFEGETTMQAHTDALDAFVSLHRSGLTEAGFLRAHGVLMSNRDSCEEGEKGMYRYRRIRVGDRLMPPASMVPELTREVIDRADRLTSFKVADLLVKIHPFADGNGRMARLVLCHLNVVRNEQPIPFEGRYAMHAQQTFVDWIAARYPRCDEDCEPVEPGSIQNHPWEDIIRKEISQ